MAVAGGIRTGGRERVCARSRRHRTTALLGALVISTVGLPAVLGVTATAVLAADAEPLAVARAIAADQSLLTGAEFLSLPPGGGSAAIRTAPLAGFPTGANPEYVVLSTGKADIAPLANTATNSGADLGGPSVRGNTDYDVTVLKVSFTVPSTANCLVGMNFRFLSEEFPEYVGSGYNDAFIAELDQSTWSTAGSVITAPRNFAFDPAGNPMSVNAAGQTSMAAQFAEGTTYDGATPLLTAATPITPGPHALFLSIFDQGDHFYDSAVFLDDLRFARVANVEKDCRPGADLADDRRYYALGDSYSSGFGVAPYETGTHNDAGPNDCQRSEKAYAKLIAGELGLDLSFHACQGAVTKHFYSARNATWGEAPQLDYLAADAGLVTFTIGGNDAKFTDVLAECILGFELLPFNTCHNDEKVTRPVREAFARLDNRATSPADVYPYDRIDKDVRTRTPYATRVAVGYPHFYSAEGSDRTFLPGGRCEGVKKADQRWVVEKIDELNDIIKRNALRNGFRFADPSPLFAGHELCSGGEEWIFPLLSAGRMHPTADGHEAIADAILAAIPADERPGVQVLPGQTQQFTFLVDAFKALLSIVSEWPGSDVVMTLISPSGTRYTRTTPGAGVYHANGPTWEQFEIPDPELGTWTIELFGADVDPGGELTKLSIYDEAAPNVRPTARPSLRRLPGTLLLDASSSFDPDGAIGSFTWYVASAAGETVLVGPQVELPVATEPESITLVVTDDQGLTDFKTVPTIPVDVKPGSPVNSLTLGATTTVPVALLSSAAFDATTIDAGTVRAGAGEAAATSAAHQDVNGDGRDDLLLGFAQPALEVRDGDTQLCITGVLPDGQGFTSCDVISVAAASACANPPPAGTLPGNTIVISQPGLITMGTPGDDVIYGTDGDDRIAGLDGNDTIFAGAGNDQVTGGAGDDTICGGDGNDQLSGAEGGDLLTGGAGNDDLSGGPGDDELVGGEGLDRLLAGEGSDRCRAGSDPGGSIVDCESIIPPD
jgi:lysophospholipase L1-like esterase